MPSLSASEEELRRLEEGDTPLPLSVARRYFQGMVTGWGKIAEGDGPVSPILMKAHMPIKSDKECVRVYGDDIGKPMTYHCNA